MQARPYGKSVHSRGNPNQITPARRQAILSSTSHRKTGSSRNAADESPGIEQDVDLVNPDLESNS